MNHALSRLFVALIGAILLAGAGMFAAPGSDGFRIVENPAGGYILFGPLAGQLTPQAALGQMLRQVHDSCGDRPQLSRLVQGKGGEVLAGFFTVAAKRQDGRQLTGLVIVYTPKTGTAGGAVLSDYSERFPSTANSMLQRLVQELSSRKNSTGTQNSSSSSSSAGSSSSAQAQPLQPTRFPDGSGVMGLPQGWTLVRAQMGDAVAKGPRGEMLRFGLTIAVVDPNNPQSRSLMGRAGTAPGQMVAIPYGTDPATVYKSAVSQLAQKMRKDPPSINITKVQDIPLQGGKNSLLYGDIDTHDGQGAQFLVAQLITTPPQAMGGWQMTVFQIQGPKQVMAEEGATIAAIFANYSRNSKYVNAVANAQIAQGIRETNQFVADVARYTDSSDRLTAGMSDYLRGQTVIRDTETGGHARTSDELADALMRANPNRYEAVPTSQYIKGIDY